MRLGGHIGWAWITALAIILPAFTAAAEEPAGTMKAAYDRSASFLPWNKPNMIVNDDVQVAWIGTTHMLSYKIATGTGWRFMIADTDTGARREAFDHKALASALATVTSKPVDPEHLPISAIAFPDGPARLVDVTAAGKMYRCNLAEAQCTAVPSPARQPDYSYPAQGGRFAVFTCGDDLWRVEIATGAERRLTSDGATHYGYAAVSGASSPISRKRLGLPSAPAGSFSPDGAKFLTFRLDERETPDVTVIEHVPAGATAKPKALGFRSAYPGDHHAVAELYLFDLATGTASKLDHPPTIPSQRGPIALDQAHWSADSRSVYFVDYADLFHERALFRTDAATGHTVRLISETSRTSEYSYSTPDWKLLSDGTILWPSERTGWRHLYRYGPDGTLRNALTRGDWVVRDIVDVDEKGGRITFSAGGREGGDPYLRRVYSVGLDGRGLTLLTPEPTDHEVRIAGPQYLGVFPIDLPPAFSADRAYFIDVHSRTDVPTKTVVRRRDGVVAVVLATAAKAPGTADYALPEPFEVMASDGKTPIYGVMFKPRGFDPARRYPVIDSMYGGPQAVFAPKTFGREISGHYGRGLAELGAIVIVVDGRGTPQRSRAFQDAGYGRLGKSGFLEDHVAALRQLAQSRPWMDLSRVGAFGYSGGGFAVVHALFDYPDIYSVGVAASAYDPMLTNWTWAAQFQGVDDAAALVSEASYRNAAQFRGKLFLLRGDLDDVADPSGTMRIADALIRNNKLFDLLIIPEGDHNVTIMPYALRRQWDFFATHLIGAAPPPDYRFLMPGEKP